MRKLTDYDVLVNDAFYRSEHIFDYIENHKNMSELDREAIENTILDALVDEGLLDPTRESLDLANLVVCDDLDHKVYEAKPRVTSIPLDIKRKMRSKAVQITGGIPISVFYAKPAGNVSFCIYDMNTALSSLFDNFSFVNCTYDSPTRPGVRSDDRPFLEVDYHDGRYYIDALTKRMFRKDWFDQEFNLEETSRVNSKEFNIEQRKIYAESITDYSSYAFYINLVKPMMDELGRSNPKFAESNYEFEKSKEYFPREFVEAEQFTQEYKQYMKQAKLNDE